MISATNIEKHLDLDFPIDKVKADIERVVKQGGYVMDNKNDILNTYRINKLTGLELISMNITIKSLDEGKAHLHIMVTEQIRNSGHKIQVDKMIDAFLERLSKALTGASDEDLKAVSAANKGCSVAILFIISTAAAALLFV